LPELQETLEQFTEERGRVILRERVCRCMIHRVEKGNLARVKEEHVLLGS